MVTTYVLVLLLVGGSFGQGGIPEQEHVLNFESPMYMCPEDVGGDFVQTFLEVKLVDGAAVLSGTVNFLQELDNNVMLELQVEKEASGRFERVMSHVVCDLCKEILDEESDYKYYLKYFRFQEQCPFAPREYDMDAFTPDASDLPVNAKNAGNYQSKIMMYNTNGDCKSQDKTLLACMKVDFVIEPAKK